MLTRLDLEHFKCFELLRLPLGNLTLLSGANASGKSSVLQALVLLHQTMKDNEWSTRLMLNGEELQLGTVTDVVDKVTGRRRFGLGLVDDERSVGWTFEADARDAMSARVVTLVLDGSSHEQPSSLHFLFPHEGMTAADHELAKRMCRLTYLTAERLGPREVYSLEDPSVTQVVGPRGEHAVSMLYWGRDEPIFAPLAVTDVVNKLLHQVTARMRHLFPGCSLTVQSVQQANAATLGIQMSDESGFHRPIHVGFGLTQVLPIIVASLSAHKGDLLLIENPEVHLHPAGQAAMGRFLAEVAAAGIQVILETHSDHVLNGVRRAVKARSIDAHKVVVHFFKNRHQDGDQVVSPTIDSSGNLDSWPDGFFDQYDKDMNYFAGWGE